MRSAIFVILGASATALLGGCAAAHSPQILQINKMINELDVGDLGTVVCDVTHQPGTFDPSSNRHLRQIGFANADVATGAVELLETSNFVVVNESQTSRGNLLNFESHGDMTASVGTVTGDHAGDVIPTDGQEDCLVPDDGLTFVSFSLPQ
ncbi:hypothetical protein IFT90_15405 [Frigoribacterium sp. CFBP 8766]|uniref:hypothetical protein n=1 Tax=Frigoribacterium sp. CFBP 8766 TaxID=2775273 RepID=UPI0017827E82|nr:hypothetical protein [Frigoribacterium sp. CFBP 8766]MBD8585941.1 hypothetical protein [Frigoribacterium sp. CFBP 8766]